MENNRKSAIRALLGATALMSMGIPMGTPTPRRQSSSKLDGHTPWNTIKDAKVRKSRAKERRAKQARKLNWP